MDLSVVIPVFNEEENIRELHRRLGIVLGTLGKTSEIILVDDGSSDDSVRVMRELASEDPRVRVIKLRRNFGKSYALTAGFRAAAGDLIATLDADLQNPPEDLPKLIKALGDSDIASGWRSRRNDPLDKTLPSRIFNALAASLTGLKLRDINCGFKVYRAPAAKSLLPIYGEHHRLLPVLASRLGFRTVEVEVNHAPRSRGVSKYGWSRGVRGILDLLSVVFIGKFMDRPMHFFGPVGVVLGLIGAALFAYLAAVWFGGHSIGTRPLFSVSIFLMLSGMQFFFTGLLAEIITRHAKRED